MWPGQAEVDRLRREVAGCGSGSRIEEVEVIASPYRVCPIGAHVDHQQGVSVAMCISTGILLGFVPTSDGVSWRGKVLAQR